MSDNKLEAIWDDRLLIKAYDDSVGLARETLARRIADSTNRHEAAEAEPEPEDKTDLTSTPDLEPEQDLEQEQNVFNAGDYARATYIDGVDYEGVIMSINEKSASCILRYIGYGNEQEVALADLLPTWGNTARREQLHYAKVAAIDEAQEAEQPGQRAKAFKKSVPKHAGKQQTSSGSRMNHGSVPAGLVMPPMPLVPPMFGPGNHGMGGEPEQDFVAMLTAWYMSGYYTGLYQGKKESSAKKKPSTKK